MEKRFKYLFRKYLNNTCTKEEFDEVFNYLHPQQNADLPGDWIREVYDEEVKEIKPRKRRLQVAAVILVVVIITAISGLALKKGNEKVAVIKELADSVIRFTKKAEYKYLLLPDSSQVWLNAASSLEFGKRFAQDKREVVLKGEAFFDVKHSDRMPFIIHSGKLSVQVLGTAFNIKAYPDLQKLTVAVKRGKVKINYGDKEVAILTKGQQLSISGYSGDVKQKTVSENDASGWQNGELIYDDYSIEDIITDLQKVYNIKIRLEDTTVRSLHITTSFKKEAGITKALEVLCRLGDLELKRENEIYIIK